MTEAEFQRSVIELAQALGYLVHHVRPAMRQSGKWSTPIQGHKGFPDLVFAHPTGRVLFVELKSENGVLSPEQKDWGEALARSSPYYVWYPSDWDHLVSILNVYRHG